MLDRTFVGFARYPAAAAPDLHRVSGSGLALDGDAKAGPDMLDCSLDREQSSRSGVAPPDLPRSLGEVRQQQLHDWLSLGGDTLGIAALLGDRQIDFVRHEDLADGGEITGAKDESRAVETIGQAAPGRIGEKHLALQGT